MKRLRVVSSLCLLLALLAVPVLAGPPAQTPPRPGRSTAHPREASRLQMTIMEDALQRAVEAAHSHAVESAQLAAGMPPLFAMEGNTRVRGFRLDGYGVFFDVDLPPVPKTVEWSLTVLDRGVADMADDLDQVEQQLRQISDPRAGRAREIIRRLQASVGPAAGATKGQARNVVDERRSAPPSPFAGYIAEIKGTLSQIMLQFGANIQLEADDWLHVAAREMAPKLLPGNPTEATITLRIKGSDLAALKAGRLTAEEAVGRVEITEVY